MRKYMLFNPMGGPPWEYPAIKKAELILDISNIKFISSEHIRLEDGVDKFGVQKGANRGIEVKSHPTLTDAYLVTMHNVDGKHPSWNTNVQMHPKRMKVIRQSENKIELIGFGSDDFGNDFSDYGLTLLLKDGVIEAIVLHMLEKEVDIEYYKYSQESVDLYNKACDYKAKGDFTNAIDLYKKALELKPDYLNALNNLGNLYSSMEQFNEALIYLSKAAEIAPNDPIIINNLSICLMELNKLDEAKLGFERAIKIKPDFYQAYNNLGKLYSLKSDLLGAKKCFEQALKINPNDQRVQLRLYSTNELLKQYSEKELKELLSKYNNNRMENKEDFDTLIRKAGIYGLSNDTGDAVYFFNQALEIDPESFIALSGLSTVYLHSGDYNKCIDYARKALAVNDKHKESYFNIGAAGFYLDNFGLSVENLNKFLSLVENEEDNIDGNYIIGLAYYGLADYNKSIHHLEKTTESEYNSKGSVFYAIANSYIALGDEINGLLNMKKAGSLGNEDANQWLSNNRF